MNSRALFRLAALLAGTTLACGTPLAQDHSMHDHSMHDHANHGHEHHAHAMPTTVQRSVTGYAVPDMELVDMHGKTVSLKQELETEGPVLVNFIFTTCTAVCPITSATFAQVQEDLAARGKSFRMVSISIDPEQDTPARLREYAARYGAGDDWHFLTGDAGRILAVQKAFDAYRGGKMSHAPLTYLREGPGKPWVRYEGFVNADTLVSEVNRMDTSQLAEHHHHHHHH